MEGILEEADFSTSRLRRCCFTINNYDSETIGYLLKTVDYCYILFGMEVSPKGTPHIQGYVEFNKPLYFHQIKDLMPRAHIEPCRGTQSQNIDYCKKSGNFKEFGSPRSQGRRNDLKGLIPICTTARSMRSVIEDSDLSLQAFKAIKDLMPILGVQRNWHTKVEWFWGPSGTGKTRTAFELFNADPVSFYFKSNGSKEWWQGYDGQPNVLIDDIRPDDFSFQYLLGLFDRYPFTVETKGGSRQFLAEHIIVTCPYDVDTFLRKSFSAEGEKFNQFIRRVDNVKEFKL